MLDGIRSDVSFGDDEFEIEIQVSSCRGVKIVS